MKVKFLKKVRKRFKWFWDAEKAYWVLLDLKEQTRYVYLYNWEVMERIISLLMGFGSSNSYLHRHNRRFEINKFRYALKKYEAKKL